MKPALLRKPRFSPSLSRSEGEGWGGVLLPLLSRLLTHNNQSTRGARSPPPPSPSPSAKGREKKHAFSLALSLSLLLSLALSTTSALAQPAKPELPPEFTSTAEEKRFHALVSELRCVMCQNQSLADSNAQIARDLRNEVLSLMRQGKSDAEIKEFLVARYGEFVLYRPQVESKTWLLWFGPALVLLAGGVLVAGLVRRRSSNAAPVADDDQEW